MMLTGSLIQTGKIHQWLCIHTWGSVVTRRSVRKIMIARSTMQHEFVVLEIANSEVE